MENDFLLTEYRWFRLKEDRLTDINATAEYDLDVDGQLFFNISYMSLVDNYIKRYERNSL